MQKLIDACLAAFLVEAGNVDAGEQRVRVDLEAAV